jgi:two-component sensor histidine kinase
LIFISNQQFSELFHPDDFPRIQQHISDISQANDDEILEIEYQFKHLNGEWIWLISKDAVFTRNLDGTVKEFIGTFLDITYRKKGEMQIRNALKEKETLLRELYHRTKNNMQVIMAMINLQTQNIKDENILQMFSETSNRISTMALVHEKLYQTKDLSQINLKDYFTDLINLLSNNYQLISEGIRIKTDMSNVMVTIDSAIPCGLIMNELISNAFKHAFPENQRGEIQISLKMIDDQEIELIIGDDGIGLPEGFEYRDTDTMGLQTIVALAEGQLLGTLKVAKGKGTKFHITFREMPHKKRV